MKKTIILFTLFISLLLQAQEIKEGTLTNRDILDALDMKAWVCEIENPDGFDTLEVSIEAHQKNKSNQWKEPDKSGHSSVFSEKKTKERVVVVIQGDRIFLKLASGYGDQSIDLSDYKLERETYHNVGSIGQKTDNGFIIMSQSIERGKVRESIDSKDFYLLVKITTE